MFTHKCIKLSCDKTYTDSDPDAYYCDTCNVERKKIAQEVDKRIKVSSRPSKSDFQIYEEIRKAKRTPFVHARDLGI